MNRTHFFKRPSNATVRIFNFRAYFSLLTCIKATQQMFICLYGEAPPRDPTPYPFTNHFFYVKGNPFVYLLLTNGISFTDLISNFASLLTAVTALTFK